MILYVCMCVSAHSCAHVCGGRKEVNRVQPGMPFLLKCHRFPLSNPLSVPLSFLLFFLPPFLPSFCKTKSVSRTWGSCNRLCWLARKPQEYACLLLANAGIIKRDCHAWFFTWLLRTDSDSYVWVSSKC